MSIDLLNPQTALGQTPTGLLYPLQVSEAGYVLPSQTLASYAAFNPILGFRVSKTENVQTAGVDLFTVTGKVWITAWLGEVTNAIDVAVNNYQLRVKTDNSAICAATSLANAAVGYMWSLAADASLTLLTGSSYAVSVVKATDNKGPGLANRFIGLAGGSCILQSTHTGGAASDAMIHTVCYWPMEASAAIVAL